MVGVVSGKRSSSGMKLRLSLLLRLLLLILFCTLGCEGFLKKDIFDLKDPFYDDTLTCSSSLYSAASVWT